MKFFVAAIVAVTACYSPHYRDCDVQCNGGTCPAGLECETTIGMCRLPGMTGPCLGGDAPTDTPVNGIPLDMYQAAGFTAFCSRQVRCGASDDAALCLSLFENIVPASTSLFAAVAAGKVIYHPDLAQTCVNGVSSIGCDRDSFEKSQANGVTCATVFEGTIGGGGACGLDEECVSQFCDRSACSSTPVGTCCSGTCVGNSAPAVRQINEACGKRDVCVNGYCGANGLCKPFLSGNANCTIGVDVCVPGYFCSSTTGGCVAYADTGKGCSNNADCKHQADVCQNGACLTGGLTNAPCSASSPNCQDFYWCDTSSAVCKQPPGLNQSCAASPICAAGYCDTSSRVCTARRSDGTVCDPTQGNQDCESRYCYTGASGTGDCKPMPICD